MTPIPSPKPTHSSLVSCALVFGALLVAAPLAGCLAEEDGADADLDEPEALGDTEQAVARGWFSLQQNGIGTTTGTAAGLSTQLSVKYSADGTGYALGYTQRMSWSPAVNHVTLLVRVDCADGQILFNGVSEVLGSSGSAVTTPHCPRNVRAVTGYVAMYVDN